MILLSKLTSFLMFMECNLICPNCFSVLLLFSSLLMELAALSSKGVCIDGIHASAELSQTGYEILLDIN